ncbi:hypothetical protein L6452_01705 [Arctium lappa]|uniref:Uncharacterized protein n=1 Tax=Arctium lappa TaxID=4217 RepID=A0ACB9FHD0_ARCLA|nr:hypothetical protein L6452_01705 [Arctium lappa]
MDVYHKILLSSTYLILIFRENTFRALNKSFDEDISDVSLLKSVSELTSESDLALFADISEYLQRKTCVIFNTFTIQNWG